jgi:hypothetical protein
MAQILCALSTSMLSSVRGAGQDYLPLEAEGSPPS